MPLRLLGSLFRSPSLRAAAGMGLSGIALAAGNLLLARGLPPEEFARFTLLFAIAMIGISVGPLGADVILTRREFTPTHALHGQVLITCAAVGLVLAAIAGVLYPLPLPLLAALMALTVFGGLLTIAVAYYRSRQRFGTAMTLTLSVNLSVLIAAVVTLAVKGEGAVLPSFIMAGCLLLTALGGWRAVTAPATSGAVNQPYQWGEGMSAVTFAAAGMILAAMDRLVIPNSLGLAALATFSVLSTVAGSPFQMLHLGVGYTLLPALRNAPDAASRRRVFRHESLVMLGVAALAAVVVVVVTPWVLHVILAGRYAIGMDLLVAAIVSGLFKLSGSLMAAVVNALGNARELLRMSLLGWVAIGVSFVGAVVGSRWGLTGLVYGVSMGWLFRAGGIAIMALPHLAARDR